MSSKNWGGVGETVKTVGWAVVIAIVVRTVAFEPFNIPSGSMIPTLLVGGLGVMNAVKSYLDGKLATIATLKCLGATARQVFQVYLIQIAVIALIGIAIGLLLGAGAAATVIWVLGDRFGWQAAGGFYVLPLLLAALFGAVVAVTFTLPPLGRAGQVSPAALFRSVIAPQQARIGRTATAAVVLGVLALAGNQLQHPLAQHRR